MAVWRRNVCNPIVGMVDYELIAGLIRGGRRFIAGARFEHTTYQIFVSGSVWPIIVKSHMCKELQKFAVSVSRQR